MQRLASQDVALRTQMLQINKHLALMETKFQDEVLQIKVSLTCMQIKRRLSGLAPL